MKINATSLPKLNKDPKDWAQVKPSAVAAGSPAQMANVLEMAIQDIQRLAREREVLITAYVDAQARTGNDCQQRIEI